MPEDGEDATWGISFACYTLSNKMRELKCAVYKQNEVLLSNLQGLL